MKILFYTFPIGHLVSDREYDRLKNGFAKLGMELIRWHKDNKKYKEDYDVVMVKGFSHTWEEIPHEKPVVFYNIGTEYKENIDLKEANEPLRELWHNAWGIVSISEYCLDITKKVFGDSFNWRETIIPACEPNLPETYPALKDKLKLATTCIPRPVKRLEETKRLCEKFGIELVTAEGDVTDFSYYHQCHGYIHLSRKEGMPNTVLEAMSYGLPCIVTNYGGAKEAVGDAGVVIKNDPEDILFDLDNIEPVDEWLFAEAARKFALNLGDLRNRVRERVLTELNDKICAEKFLNLFTTLCNQAKN